MIQFAAFRGMRPATSPKLLPEGFGTLARDCDLESGAILPINARSVEATLSKTGEIKTIYRMQDGTWLHWTEEVSVARVPIANNTNDRLIFTGTDQPRMTDATKAKEGGGTNYPEVSYAAGLPAPDKILDVAVGQSTPDGLQLQWDIAGTVNDTVGSKVARVYTYTFVSTWGGVTYEGPPADPSKLAYTNDDSLVTLTNFAQMPVGPYLINAVRIYRSEAGGAYQQVAEVPFPTTSYQDTVATDALGSDIDTELWSAPPTGLKGIVAMANGMLAGFVGNTVSLSQPYQGHAWPEDYQIIVDDEIAGLVPMGNMLLIITDGVPVLAVGAHPTAVSSNKIKRGAAAVSARSIVDTGAGAIYASNEGLVLLTASGSSLITEGVISKEYWQSLVPSTIHGCWHDEKYFGFYNGVGGFIFDPATKDIRLISEYCTAAFSIDGELYMANDGNVYKWRGSATPLTALWESKEYETPPTTFAAARVDAQAYPVTFKLYADGVLKHTETVTNPVPFRLPSGYTGRTWKVSLEGTETINGAVIAETIGEIR